MCLPIVTLHILLQTGQIRSILLLEQAPPAKYQYINCVLPTILWNHDFKYPKMAVVTMESNAHNITLCHSQKYCIMLIPDCK